jgi:phosphoribosylaminoimidazole-succinocarboxamide synthase
VGLGLVDVDLVQAAEQRTRGYLPLIEAERKRMATPGAGGLLGSKAVPADVLPGATRYVGKVRDVYLLDGDDDDGDNAGGGTEGGGGGGEKGRGSSMVMVATGRQSAFDRHLASVPFKGQVLNLISLWWFEQTKHLVPNHVLYSPHPCALVGKRCKVFPVEFVVRGYLTGTTATSMWTHYNNGERVYCGHALPEGLVKNQKLSWVEALLTPTTKSEEHDEPISAAEVVATGLMTQADWDTCEAYAKTLFEFGSRAAREKGLILCDTKYEFGRCAAAAGPNDGEGGDYTIVLCDELHTPDSSRYWLAGGYEERFAAGLEPHNVDKEFLRRWFVERCDPYAADVELPTAPPDLICELSRRYVLLFELITGTRFPFPSPEDAAAAAAGLVDLDEQLFEALRKARAAGKMKAPGSISAPKEPAPGVSVVPFGFDRSSGR